MKTLCQRERIQQGLCRDAVPTVTIQLADNDLLTTDTSMAVFDFLLDVNEQLIVKAELIFLIYQKLEQKGPSCRVSFGFKPVPTSIDVLARDKPLHW